MALQEIVYLATGNIGKMDFTIAKMVFDP